MSLLYSGCYILCNNPFYFVYVVPANRGFFPLTYKAWKITSCWMHFLLPSQEETKWPLCQVTVEKGPVTFIANPAGVSCSMFRSFKQSSPIKEVRCCRHSACPFDAATCNRLLSHSSWILSRLSAAKCGCEKNRMLVTTQDKKIHLSSQPQTQTKHKEVSQ